MSRTVEQLRALRGVPKGQVTRLQQWAAENVNDASLQQVEVKLEQLRKYEAQFDKYQEDLEALDPDECGPEATERSEFEDRVTTIKAKLLERQAFLQEGSFHDATGHSISVDLSSSELPQYEIPKFDGDYKAFPQYIDAFDALVHNSRDRHLTDVRKLAILKSTVTGRALDAIKDLPMNAANYLQARNILQARFENKRLILDAHLRGLWEVSKVSDTSGLRKLCDHINAVRQGLSTLATPEQIADGILIHLILSKCDKDTVRKWEEQSSDKTEVQGMDAFLTYLNRRCTQLEGMEFALQTKVTSTPEKSTKSKLHSNVSVSVPSTCPHCEEDHQLAACPKFLTLQSPYDRYELVKALGKCTRCVNGSKGECKCNVRCKTCRGTHNKLLHFERTQPQTPTETQTQSSTGGNPSTTLTAAINKTRCKQTITDAGIQPFLDPSRDVYTFLATALLKVRTFDGNYVILRVLFDGGSQPHLITDRAARLLRLKQQKMYAPLELHGVNSTVSLRNVIVARVKSLHDDFEDDVVLVIHPKLRQSHPTQPVDVSTWQLDTQCGKLSLADPKFHVPQDVDIILNANHAYRYLLPGQVSLGPGRPSLQNTVLGWVVVGDMLNKESPIPLNASTLISSISDTRPQDDLSLLMQRFWECEAIVSQPLQSRSERECEQHFKETYSRKPDGRFVVKLPFARPPALLGSSRHIALQRLTGIKKKILSCPEYGEQYKAFMSEYIELGHCSKIDPPPATEPHYYIPHFAVMNPESTTTKLRVVFDASCKTETGLSLNDLLMVGPKVQKDLVAHLLHFRWVPIALTGDLSKMYRQIEVSPEDRKCQLMLWYEPDMETISTYQLNTVTYGTASASFAAIRSLHELAKSDGASYPLGAEALTTNFYVDDLLSGGQTADEVVSKHDQLQQLLKQAKMTLRKIQSNSKEVMDRIPDELKGSYINIGDKDVIKTLGLHWMPEPDHFVYYYEPSGHVKMTMRAVLSEISRLFDPLGLVQPVIVKAKIFMQHLWASKLKWDDLLSEEDSQNWVKFRQELCQISKIVVPRCVVDKGADWIEVHGFCDASEKAYGACLYVRNVDANGAGAARLYISKTRVAPLKTQSLPRLELLGALTLSELWTLVSQELPVKPRRVVLWSDSTIALKWIQASPHKWVPYVGTRVAKIQSGTEQAEWRFVPSEHNPADLASRGLLPSQLATSELWFNGPSFLQKDPSHWPAPVDLPLEVPDTKRQVCALQSVNEPDVIQRCKYVRIAPLFKFLAWEKVRRVFAYVSRFIQRVQQKFRTKQQIYTPQMDVAPITAEEIKSGVFLMAKLVQRNRFSKEVKLLQEHETCPGSSKLRTLAPFIDECGVLRVGGRTGNAPDAPFDQKFPVVLPPDHIMSEMIFSWTHVQNLHVGQNSLIATVRQQFWILRSKVLANRTVRTCMRCQRVKPIPGSQLMGDLPVDRVTPVPRAFCTTSVDYAGPFTVHYRGRGSRTTKAYMAVFVCFSTKAVHLEVVEDLSTDAFINTLQRFVSRRGSPYKIYSDNATNFVGARNKLTEWYKLLSNGKEQDQVPKWCRDNKGITWSFMPPRSPHFGGLHEAAVKIAKQHLMKVIGLSTLTFPELSTVVAMVEATLNSRPLTPLSINPIDGQPLTPGHFLIGGPINALPEPTLDDVSTDYVHKWGKVIEIKQQFWRKWSKEYLSTLQHRNKWTSPKPNLKINDLVLLIDNNAPSLKWALGRVIQVFPGHDEMVRVVNVRTATGVYKRSVTEICPLINTDSSIW